MRPSRTRPEGYHAYEEVFLASLSHSIASPTTEWPTVRCLDEDIIRSAVQKH